MRCSRDRGCRTDATCFAISLTERRRMQMVNRRRWPPTHSMAVRDDMRAMATLAFSRAQLAFSRVDFDAAGSEAHIAME